MSDHLWQRWESHYRSLQIDPGRICQDGIVDPAQFATAYPRVLFVLPEVNDWDGGDIRSLLRSGAKYQVWHTVGRWAAGILNGFPDYDVIDTYSAICSALMSVAAIDLKKAGGGSSSDYSVINAYAAQDQNLLRDQIKLIKPTIIVACGTLDPLVWVLGLKVDPEKPLDRVWITSKGIRVIPWRHPNRAGNRSTYAALGRLLSAEVEAMPLPSDPK